ncbi:MAG: hypothetical protein OXH14_14655 [Alphaproteobacteria bacterium]|nr:hypothetical protein [Alphaproteobacteria bacterium]
MHVLLAAGGQRAGMAAVPHGGPGANVVDDVIARRPDAFCEACHAAQAKALRDRFELVLAAGTAVG